MPGTFQILRRGHAPVFAGTVLRIHSRYSRRSCECPLRMPLHALSGDVFHTLEGLVHLSKFRLEVFDGITDVHESQHARIVGQSKYLLR
jgi:hypothetical protein